MKVAVPKVGTLNARVGVGFESVSAQEECRHRMRLHLERSGVHEQSRNDQVDIDTLVTLTAVKFQAFATLLREFRH